MEKKREVIREKLARKIQVIESERMGVKWRDWEERERRESRGRGGM